MHRSIFESWEVFMVALCASDSFPVIRKVWRKAHNIRGKRNLNVLFSIRQPPAPGFAAIRWQEV